MKGLIIHTKKSEGVCMFILGEDGNEYFSHKSLLADGSKWKYCYEGNVVVFDAKPPLRGEKRRCAVNVWVNPIPDPNKTEKSKRSLESRINREKNRADKHRRERATKICESNRKWNEYQREHGNRGTILIVNGVKA